MVDTLDLARTVIASAKQKRLRVAVAESLTGGLLAATLISVPGASAVVSGAVVAYNSDVKKGLLGVDEQLLARFGAVNADVAKQMSFGVRGACATVDFNGILSSAEVGVSTTGVAGPDPDPFSGEPAGLVWVGLSKAGTETAFKFNFMGDRREIRLASVHAALQQLQKIIC